jgi:hypothetical protein
LRTTLGVSNKYLSRILSNYVLQGTRPIHSHRNPTDMDTANPNHMCMVAPIMLTILSLQPQPRVDPVYAYQQGKSYGGISGVPHPQPALSPYPQSSERPYPSQAPQQQAYLRQQQQAQHSPEYSPGIHVEQVQLPQSGAILCAGWKGPSWSGVLCFSARCKECNISARANPSIEPTITRCTPRSDSATNRHRETMHQLPTQHLSYTNPDPPQSQYPCSHTTKTLPQMPPNASAGGVSSLHRSATATSVTGSALYFCTTSATALSHCAWWNY